MARSACCSPTAVCYACFIGRPRTCVPHRRGAAPAASRKTPAFARRHRRLPAPDAANAALQSSTASMLLSARTASRLSLNSSKMMPGGKSPFARLRCQARQHGRFSTAHGRARLAGRDCGPSWPRPIADGGDRSSSTWRIRLHDGIAPAMSWLFCFDSGGFGVRGPSRDLAANESAELLRRHRRNDYADARELFARCGQRQEFFTLGVKPVDDRLGVYPPAPAARTRSWLPKPGIASAREGRFLGVSSLRVGDASRRCRAACRPAFAGSRAKNPPKRARSIAATHHVGHGLRHANDRRPR